MKFRIFKTLIYIYNDLPGNFLRSFFIIMIQETYHWACSQFLHCPLGNFFIDKLTACLKPAAHEGYEAVSSACSSRVRIVFVRI